MSVSRSMNTANGVSLKARRCAAMSFLMVGCADRSPVLRNYRLARGFICIVLGDAAHIARDASKCRHIFLLALPDREQDFPASSAKAGSVPVHHI